MTTQQLVEQYVPLANKLAFRKKKSLPRFVDVEDLKSAAYLGLVEAASRFNPDLGVSFSTFAYPRINGAILDYLRDLGWLKRGESFHILSLDTPAADGENCFLSDTVKAKVERDNGEEMLEVVSFDMDEQAKKVLRFYFIDEMSMKEVGEKFGVSEGRVSQLIKQYKNRIRDTWSEEELMELAA